MDSRTSSILINLDLNLDGLKVADAYGTSKKGIYESEHDNGTKSYSSLRSTVKECYLTGSLKYGNNFIM